MAVASACPVLYNNEDKITGNYESMETYLYDRRAVRRYRHMLYFVPGMRSLTRAFGEWVWGCQSRFLFLAFEVDEKRWKQKLRRS